MMLPVVSHLRRKGVLLWVYLDDFLIIAPTIEDCALHTQWLADLLCRLGVQIHITKSVLTPTRVLVFFWFLTGPARRDGSDTTTQAQVSTPQCAWINGSRNTNLL